MAVNKSKPRTKGAKRARPPRKSGGEVKIPAVGAAKSKPRRTGARTKSDGRPATTMKRTRSGRQENKEGSSASQVIDARIKELGNWRGRALAQVRAIIRKADPEVVEEVKWRKPSNPAGVPVWSHAGILCTGETYNSVVKLTFPFGASLPDPAGLFNSSLAGNARRAIDLHEGDNIDRQALGALIRAAVALNASQRAR